LLILDSGILDLSQYLIVDKVLFQATIDFPFAHAIDSFLELVIGLDHFSNPAEAPKTSRDLIQFMVFQKLNPARLLNVLDVEFLPISSATLTRFAFHEGDNFLDVFLTMAVVAIPFREFIRRETDKQNDHKHSSHLRLKWQLPQDSIPCHSAWYF